MTWLRFNPRSADTASIYAHLEESVGPLYARVDAVFAESGFAVAKKEVREGHVERDASGRLHLKVVDSNIVPFDLKTTSSGFWKLFSSAAAMDLNGGVYKVGAFYSQTYGDVSFNWITLLLSLNCQSGNRCDSRHHSCAFLRESAASRL